MTARRLIITATLIISCGCATAREPVPTQPDSTSVAPIYVHFMTQGAPRDSLMLRVSLCYSDGFRCGGHSFVVVEELRWPRPEPRIVVVDDFNLTLVDDEDEWLVGVSRIDGAYLDGKGRQLPPVEIPGMRAGELGGTFLHPFEFVTWLTPHEFVIADSRARYTIAWTAPQSLVLVDVVAVDRD